MLKINSAKILIVFSVLFFVSKPFIGYSIFNRHHPPAEENIFVKVFSKRKLEFSEDSINIFSDQDKFWFPDQPFALRFCFFLSLILPLVSISAGNKRDFFDKRYKTIHDKPAYLLHGSFLI